MTDDRKNETMTEAVRAHGIARENAMGWAMRTATLGEDAMAILARAQLYEEYVLGPLVGTAADRRETGVRADHL